MKKIQTKIGIELLIPINILFVLGLYQGISKNDITAISISILVIIFVNIVLFGISYSIENDVLRIKRVFHNIKIDIKNITKIEKTWNLLSSPAPSIFGRVEIYYQKDSVVISPKNYEEFKNELLKINPNIIIKE
jgi:hypothetical protein